MGLLSIIRFNIRLLTWVKFVEFLRRNSLFSTLKICLTYAYILLNLSQYMLMNVIVIKKEFIERYHE